MWDKAVTHAPGETESTARDFITLVRKACNSQLTHCLLLEYLVTASNENGKQRKSQKRWDYCK